MFNIQITNKIKIITNLQIQKKQYQVITKCQNKKNQVTNNIKSNKRIFQKNLKVLITMMMRFKINNKMRKSKKKQYKIILMKQMKNNKINKIMKIYKKIQMQLLFYQKKKIGKQLYYHNKQNLRQKNKICQFPYWEIPNSQFQRAQKFGEYVFSSFLIFKSKFFQTKQKLANYHHNVFFQQFYCSMFINISIFTQVLQFLLCFLLLFCYFQYTGVQKLYLKNKKINLFLKNLNQLIINPNQFKMKVKNVQYAIVNMNQEIKLYSFPVKENIISMIIVQENGQKQILHVLYVELIFLKIHNNKKKIKNIIKIQIEFYNIIQQKKNLQVFIYNQQIVSINYYNLVLQQKYYFLNIFKRNKLVPYSTFYLQIILIFLNKFQNQTNIQYFSLYI